MPFDGTNWEKSQNVQIADILLRAADLISDPARHCRRSFMRFNEGGEMQYCAAGAIGQEARGTPLVLLATKAVNRWLERHRGCRHGVEFFNDTFPHAEVIEAMRAAAAELVE